MINIVITDYTGNSSDLQFLNVAGWLTEATMVPNVFVQNGAWKIRLVFAWAKNPMRMLCRCINEAYASKSKAEIIAGYLKETTQYDSQPLQPISTYDFNLCYN